MKKIVLTDGIVLLNVCDEYLLVATKEARGKAPYLQHINEASACYWQMLEEGMDAKEMAKAASREFQLHPQKAIQSIQLFLKQMMQKGYLTIVEVEDQS